MYNSVETDVQLEELLDECWQSRGDFPTDVTFVYQNCLDEVDYEVGIL